MKLNENIPYTEKDGILYPWLDAEEPEPKSLGKYGLMREKYLRECDPITEMQMFLDGSLVPHLYQVQEQASEMVERMVQRMAEQSDLPDRNTQPIQWAQEMTMLKAQAEEVVIRELIYTD